MIRGLSDKRYPVRVEALDPSQDEVRAIPEAIPDDFGNNVHRLCENLREIEDPYSHREVVSPSEEDFCGER